MHDICRSGAGLVETMCRSEPESQIDAILRDGTEERAGLRMLLAGRPCTHKRLSDQVSDNRHSQLWAPAGIHGRSVSVPGRACWGAGVTVSTWVRDEEARASASSMEDASEKVFAQA